MFKKVVFVTVSAFLTTLTLSAQPNKAATQKQNPAKETPPSVTSPQPTKDQNSETNAAKSEADTPPWYAAFKNPDGMLVIVGTITAFFICWQSWATARAAKATEASVEAGRDTAKRQLRAYLAVVIGGGVYQDREKNLRFEGKPLMINTGQTPAHKIRFITRAAILPIPLPKEADLPETGSDSVGETTLGSQQNGSMSGIVDGFSHDNEVDGVKQMTGGKALFVWGRFTYEDVFGESHYTRFCQQLFWDGQGNVRGFYTPGRNEST